VTPSGVPPSKRNRRCIHEGPGRFAHYLSSGPNEIAPAAPVFRRSREAASPG
jgi:hypothetical protein